MKSVIVATARVADLRRGVTLDIKIRATLIQSISATNQSYYSDKTDKSRLTPIKDHWEAVRFVLLGRINILAPFFIHPWKMRGAVANKNYGMYVRWRWWNEIELARPYERIIDTVA